MMQPFSLNTLAKRNLYRKITPFILLCLPLQYAQSNPDKQDSHDKNSELRQLKQELIMLKKKVGSLENTIVHFQEGTIQKHPKAEESGYASSVMEGLSISGQLTTIYQSSSLKLKPGQLFHANGQPLSSAELSPLQHPNEGTATFSADLIVEKKFSDSDYLQFDLQFANGPGIDANFQGGAMVNNDVMEDADHHNEPYIAKAFYEHTWRFPEQWEVTMDIGKFGVNDFFDVGKDVSDQTSQFMNQAIDNNGAFDYVQDLEGHGYTYGLRLGAGNELVQLDAAFFSSDSYLQNINKKHSVLVGLTFTPEWYPGIKSVYQIYGFGNFGEYARFDDQGNLLSKNSDAINTADNADNLSKTGFGISLNHSFPSGVNVFAKYGRQDDSRDVRHYQDMDESYMLGFDVHGENWSRENDVFGMAFEIGRLTGNHRKAHEKGYTGFFDRHGGVGKGNYADERVLEMYYKYALNSHAHISFDYQWIDNFYYSQLIQDVHLFTGRLNLSF